MTPFDPPLPLLPMLLNTGEPSPLLRIAEHWLRTELVEKRRLAWEQMRSVEELLGEKQVAADEEKARQRALLQRLCAEPAAGDGARAVGDPTQRSFVCAGGFSNGRMAAYDVISK